MDKNLQRFLKNQHGGFAPKPPRRYQDSGGPGELFPQNRQAGVPPGGFIDKINIF